MGVSKRIDRFVLIGLPDDTINLINKGLSFLWEIEPKTLSDGSKAVYLLKLKKDDFRYLDHRGIPLSIRPEKKEIGKLKTISSIRIGGYIDPVDEFTKLLKVGD